MVRSERMCCIKRQLLSRVSTWSNINSSWPWNFLLHSLTLGKGQMLAGMGKGEKTFPFRLDSKRVTINWKQWKHLHPKSVVSLDGNTRVKGLHISESRNCHCAPCRGHNTHKAPRRPRGVGSDEFGSQGAPSVCVRMSETVYTQTAFGKIMRNGPISESRHWSVKRTHKIWWTWTSSHTPMKHAFGSSHIVKY